MLKICRLIFMWCDEMFTQVISHAALSRASWDQFLDRSSPRLQYGVANDKMAEKDTTVFLSFIHRTSQGLHKNIFKSPV